MEFTAEHKKEVERKIVETIIAALKDNSLSSATLPEVSRFILDTIKTIDTHEQLINFLRQLSEKWNIFSKILVIESGEAKEKKEDKEAKKVEELTEHGNIDEALRVAKAATGGQ